MHYLPDGASTIGWLGKAIFLVVGIFWLVMLVHCLRRKFKVSMDKLAWMLVLVFLPAIGAFVYLFDILKPKK
ncbi:PLDc_N domain-containing protein [Candidatus Woesearchaeota archaeon]|nr:PLDc_N domain-containing protein [Candidatus Woesearchaeota archaeon]